VQLTLQSESNSYTQELELDGSDTWKEYVFNYSDILDNNVDITQALLIFAPGETDFGYNFYYDDMTLIEVSSVNESDKLNGIEIVNNFIYFSEINSTKHVKVYDLAGRLLQNESTDGASLRINPSGLLMISINDNSGYQRTIKYLNK
jgi:hypothetical protein